MPGNLLLSTFYNGSIGPPMKYLLGSERSDLQQWNSLYIIPGSHRVERDLNIMRGSSVVVLVSVAIDRRNNLI